MNCDDACTLSLVCKALHVVADSDQAWQPRLPTTCPPSLLALFASKKHLYFRLRAGLLLTNATQAYWLDPGTDEACFMMSARSLFIVQGDDRRHWHWVSQLDSWFQDGAYLVGVCWFEVRGKFESIFQPGAYTVSFRICMKKTQKGWTESPVKFSLSTSNGHCVESERFLQGEPDNVERSSRLTPSRSLGMWFEYDAGEFLVESEMLVKLEFSMLEIDGGNWKRGLLLDGVKIQPSKILKRT